MEQINRVCHQLLEPAKGESKRTTLLTLSCGAVGSQGLRKLASSCSSKAATTPFVAMWLDHNCISSPGAIYLSQIVASSPHLRYLYLTSNAIGSSGMETLLKRVSLFQQLQVLHIGDNQINVRGAHAIAAALREPNEKCGSSNNHQHRKTRLKALHLQGNPLMDEGVEAIAEGLKENHAVQLLDLRRTGMTSVRGVRVLRDLLRHSNKTLHTILLGDDDHTHNQAKPTTSSGAASSSSWCCGCRCSCTEFPPATVGEDATMSFSSNVVGNKTERSKTVDSTTTSNSRITRTYNLHKRSRIRIGRGAAGSSSSSTNTHYPIAVVKKTKQCHPNSANVNHHHPCSSDIITMQHPSSSWCCESCELRQEMDYWLARNRAGRSHVESDDMSAGLWSRILARADHNPSVLYGMLKERPDVLMFAAATVSASPS